MKYKNLIISFIVCSAVLCGACSQKPAEINFTNVKNGDYITYYSYTVPDDAIRRGDKNFKVDDYFVPCQPGITNKPGIIIVTKLNKPIDTTKVTRQIINTTYGRVIHTHEYDANPDLTSLETVYNLPEKGKYTINYIIKDKIVAQGEIEYK